MKFIKTFEEVSNINVYRLIKSNNREKALSLVENGILDDVKSILERNFSQWVVRVLNGKSAEFDGDDGKIELNNFIGYLKQNFFKSLTNALSKDIDKSWYNTIEKELERTFNYKLDSKKWNEIIDLYKSSIEDLIKNYTDQYFHKIDINHLDQKMDNILDEKDDLEEQEEEEIAELHENDTELEDLEDRLDGLEDDLADLEEENYDDDDDEEDIKNEIKNIKTNIENIKKEISRLEKEQDINNKKKEIEEELIEKKFKNRKLELNKKIESIDDELISINKYLELSKSRYQKSMNDLLLNISTEIKNLIINSEAV